MPKTLADIRAQYPQYDRVDDQTLADALYKKFYSHADRREFDDRVGLKPYETALETLPKVLPNLAQSVAGSANSLGNLAATGVKDILAEPTLDPGVAPVMGADGKPLPVVSDPISRATRSVVNSIPSANAAITQTAEDVAADMAKRRKESDATLLANAPDVRPDSLEDYAYQTATAAADMVLPMAASIVLKNPAPMVAYGALRSGGEGYQKAIDAGLPPDKARLAAGLYAAAESIGEAVGTGKLLEGGKTLVRAVLKGIASEGVSEAATEALQAAVDAGIIGEDMTIMDALNRVKQSAIIGGITGAPFGAAGHAGRGGAPEAPVADPVAQAVQPAAVSAVEPMAPENQFALPAPEIMLALPPPAEPIDVTRRHGPAPEIESNIQAEQEAAFQAQSAVQKTRQAETAALLATARETISPLGNFSKDDVPGPAVQRVNTWRMQTGKPVDAPITVEDMARAKVPQSVIDGVIAQRRPMTEGQTLSPSEVRAAASAKNIITDDANFKELAFRTTGSRNIDRMNQVQLKALHSTLETLPAHEKLVTVPVAETSPFTEGQYNKALDAIRNQGRFTLKAIKDATGLTSEKDAQAVRDAMVRRGQLTQRSKNDYRLYDVLGTERQQTPADLPKGAFTEHVVKKLPVNKIGVKVNGKSVGLFASGTEARDKVRAERAKDPKAAIELGQAEEVAYGVMENRYDEKGNLLGQVVVDTHRDESAARRAADQRNTPDTSARYTQTVVEPAAPPVPSGMVRMYHGGRSGRSDFTGTTDFFSSDPAYAEGYARKNWGDDGAVFYVDVPRNDPMFDSDYPEQSVDNGFTVNAELPTELASKRKLYVPSKTVSNNAVRRAPPPAALAGRTKEIAANLNAIAKQRGLPLLGTKVTIQNDIRAPDGTSVEGVYLQNLIAITAGNLDADMTTAEVTDRLAQVMDHEIIHALKQAGVLAPETEGWKTIVNYARKAKRPGSRETFVEWARRNYAGVPGYTTDADIEEEAIAEAFRVWAANKRNVSGKPGTVFRQLVEWFKRLFSSIPNDIFTNIETGKLVRDALTPPGADQPRAKAGKEMMEAQIAVQNAMAAEDINAAQVKSRQFLRARAQAREDRFGRSGPKTVLGTTPSRTYDTAAVIERPLVDEITQRYREKAGVQNTGLATFLPEDIDYLKRVADAQQKAAHNPEALDVAKAYRALINETKAMFDNLGPLAVERFAGDGEPYAAPEAMFADIAAGRLKMRLSDDLFGEGADNPGHPMNAASGRAATDGTPLTNNDLFRVVHDVYGRGPNGLRSDPRGDYNAYHEHARLVSPEARQALATETLAQSAWHHYGPHLRRRDGTVPRAGDIDYLSPNAKEFAEQKAFILPDALLDADRGWKLANDAAIAVDDASQVDLPRYMIAYHGTPHRFDRFSSEAIGTGEGAQAFGYGLYFAGDRDIADGYRKTLSKETFSVADGAIWSPDNLQHMNVRSAANRNGTDLDATLNRARELLVSAPPATRGMLEADIATLENLKQRGGLKENSGRLMTVDIPEDTELLDWDKPLTEQPPAVANKLRKVFAKHPEIATDMGLSTADEAWIDIVKAGQTLGDVYFGLQDTFGSDRAVSAALSEEGIPGHRFLDGNSRKPGVPASYNYVVYDDDRVQVVSAEPKYSVFDDKLPGGRLYGNPNRSPGGALSTPETPSPAFAVQRDGNRFFGGEMADEQLRMAIEGTDGTSIIYLTPDEFTALAGPQANPEQEVYDAAIAEGYKFNTLPSLVVDGYAGIVRAPETDGTFSARALAGKADLIPVVLYPKRKESMGLVTALEANGMKVPWPHTGRQENFPDARGTEPKYSLTAPYGERVPMTPPDTANIVDQRIDTWVGKKLHAIGRGKIGVGKVPSVFDLRIKFQDKMLSVKEMIENVEAMGGKVTDETNVYMLEQLAGSRTVHLIEHRTDTLYEPLFEALAEAGKGIGHPAITPKEFDDFLIARHAPERNVHVRARGSKIKNPAGISDAEAEAILDKMAMEGKYPKLQQLANMADAIAKDTTQTRVDAGLITQAAADASPYEHYVPLRGKTEEDLDPEDVYDPQTRARSGKGYTVGGREDRAVTGRERKAGDILSHLMLQNTEAVIRAEKNRVALAFMRLIQDNPQTGYGSIMKTAPTRQVVGANGMIREAGDPSYRQRPDVFTAKYNGKEIIAQVNDPRVARAMKSDYVSQSGAFVNFLGRMNRYLATVNTSWNPEFLISNLARDMQTAGILGAQYDIKGLSGKIIKGAPKAMLGIREVLRDGTTNSPMAKAFKEMQDAGGTTEFLGLHDLDTHVRRLRRVAANTGLNPTARQALERVKMIGDFIDDYNKVAENAFRLGAYVAAREAGVSIDKSAFLAKNLTVNFNKGGENKSVMNSLYLFYNASISGTFVLMNGLKNKRVQRLVAGIAIAGALSDLLNRAMSGDDDDNGVKDYDDIPDYVLETNWVFMIPGSKDYIAIPMPYGFNVFHNFGRNLSNAFSGSPVHNPGKSAMSMAMTALGAFNPMGGSESILNFISPTFADPFMDLISNEDFAGNQIVPERPTFGVPVPESQKYWANTGDIPKWTAEQLNRLTGGNEVRKGAIDVSPETLQFWFDYATGAAGKFTTRNAGLAGNLAQGNFEDIKIGDIPFARRVVGSVTNQGNTERYYENAGEVQTVAEELKMAKEQGNGDLYRSVVARSPAQVSLITTFEKGEKVLSDLRKQIRDIRANDALPEDQKRKLVKDLKAQQDVVMTQLNKIYFAQTAPNTGR